MSTITTRSGKGSPLTHDEVDDNFTNLNSDKYEAGDSPSFGSVSVTGTVDGRDIAADGSKLDGIEAGADVTDTANVTAAGALMDSEVANLAAVKSFDPTDYVNQTSATGSAELPAGTTAQRDGTPSAGYLRFNTTEQTFEGYDGSEWWPFAGEGAGPLAGFRNAIINGNFDHWQRGTSFTANAYGADRWVNARTGTAATQSQQAFALGQTDVPNEPEYFARTVVSSVAGASNFSILAQRIEGVRTFAGQTVTLSFWAKADAAKNIAVEFEQFFGSGGSPSTGVTGIGVTTLSLTTSWQKFTVTAALPSISGKTIGTDGNNYLAMVVWFDAGSDYNARTDTLGQQSGTFDIAQVQLEAGSVATPFERRPVGTELALCQRYYERLPVGLLGQQLGNTDFGYRVSYLNAKRIAPSTAIEFPFTINADNLRVDAVQTATAIVRATCINSGFTETQFDIVLDSEL